MVTAEMLPTAVLPQMSAGLGVSEPEVGMLVSVWAAIVVIGSFPLVRLTARANRRAVIVWSLVALAASAALTAIAPDYPVAVGARLLGALAVGLLWATTNAFTADLVSDRQLARAVAVVLGGATLGMVLGTPAASLVAQALDWRAAFGALAVLAVVASVLVRMLVPAVAVAGADGHANAGTSEATGEADAASERTVGDGDATGGRRDDGGSAGGRGIRPLLVVTALVALVFVGHYGAYTFITRLVEDPAASVPGGVGAMLLVYGVASALGVVLAGRFGERTGPALVATSALTGAAVLALGVVSVHPAVGVAVIVVWAIGSGALPPLAQTLILRLAGPERRGFAGALIPVLFNLGIAIGAALASLVVGLAELAVVPPLAAGVIALAALGLLVGTRRGRRDRSRPARSPRLAQPAR
jgi:predicted MFS family arabinose efflux permease